MSGPVITMASHVAAELGISVAKVKAMVKQERLAYASNRKGDYLLDPSSVEAIARALLKVPTRSKAHRDAAKKRAETRKANKAKATTALKKN